MKRPFGLIGLTYLFVLAVVFYFYSKYLMIAIVLCAVLAVTLGVFLKIFHRKRGLSSSLIAAGITMFCATIAIFLYQNHYIQPLISKYSEKEASVTGYVCDEITLENHYALYPIMTEKINGKNERLRINVILYSRYDVEEFDEITSTLYLKYADTNTSKGNRVIFCAYEDDNFSMKPTGKKHFTLYQYAVRARKAMKQSLDALLAKDAAALSKAVLFGDKGGLDSETQNSFTKTGTSFLIVVSGLHLSIAVAVFSFILKRISRERTIVSMGAIAAVFLFTALTGFSASVSRAAIMFAVAYFGNIIFKNSDGINSLGIAAIALSAANPFSVGNIGMLMSFSASMGIILWAKHISICLDRKFHINRIKNWRLRTFFQFFTNMVGVSTSAALWIAPITIIAFHRVSPLVVIVAFITEPIASIILVCALFLSVFYLIPIIGYTTYPLAYAVNFLCRIHIKVNLFFSRLPWCSVKADKLYIYIWLGITICLVLIGYMIRAKRRYVETAVMLSVASLAIGWTFTVLTDGNATTVKINQTGAGLTVSVEREDSLSLLCCGGSDYYQFDIVDELSEKSSVVDDIIIPNSKYYSNYLYGICSELDVTKIYMNRQDAENIFIPKNLETSLIEENTTFVLKMNENTYDRIINAGNVTYQYVTLGDTTMLFIPKSADIGKLPTEYRKADYILLDSVSKNFDLLKCNKLIYTGKTNDRFTENYERISAIGNEMITLSKETLDIQL